MKKWIILACLGLGPLATSVQADSIWDRRDPRAAYLFQDNRARGVGDLLTITVSEITTANDREQRAMNKNTDARIQTDYTGASGSTQGSGTVALSGNLNFDLRNRSSRVFNGNSQLTTNRVFTDKLAVTVVDILPNGNLVVEGYRSRVVSGEERMLRITGIVRPADIGLQNTVRSEFVANFKVNYVGRGQQSSFVNQNYLSRFFNFVWPW